MEPEITGLDEDRIGKLAIDILLPIRANYLAGPRSRDRVFEALNALAFAAANVLAGTSDPTGEPKVFFLNALEINLSNPAFPKRPAQG